MNKKELKALKIVANEKILDILDALSVDYREKYYYVTAACPVHNGTREDAWSWHLDKEFWRCFSRDCQDEYGKDIYGLVRGVLDCKFPEACEFIKKIVLGDSKLNIDELAQLHANKQFIKRTKNKEQRIFPELVLNKLCYHNYLEGRGFPRKLIEDYQVGITDSQFKQMSNRIIFPIRNIDAQIVGFTGRTLYPDWKERKIGKWVHSKGFVAADNLFNIDRAAEFIKESGTVIIVEGPIDVLRLEQSGVRNSVAIFGRKLHNPQLGILLKTGANKILIALDADIAGKTGAESAFNTAKSYMQVSQVSLESGDVGDLSVEDVKRLFV